MIFWLKKQIHLDFFLITIIAVNARQLDCRCSYLAEESPGFLKVQCQLTAGEGDLRDSATENIPPNQGKGEKVW